MRKIDKYNVKLAPITSEKLIKIIKFMLERGCSEGAVELALKHELLDDKYADVREDGWLPYPTPLVDKHFHLLGFAVEGNYYDEDEEGNGNWWTYTADMVYIPELSKLYA
jgi:hypothetical protein